MRRKGKNKKVLTSFVLTCIAFYQVILKRLVTHSTNTSLFLLYINDIHKSSKEFTFYLFADDTSLTYANDNLRTLEQTVNNELEKVSERLNANKITLNVKKSSYVIFRPRQKRLPLIPQIKIFNPTLNTRVTLVMKDFVKYLGIMIDSELSWKETSY